MHLNSDLLDVYIYYRVREADAAALQLRVTAMQERLNRQYGATAQLKRRPELTEGLQTWMEVYPAASADLVRALAGAGQEAALLALTTGLRHTEFFKDVVACA